MSVDEFIEVLVEACFQPRDDDSAETQSEHFENHALWVATTRLLPRKGGARAPTRERRPPLRGQSVEKAYGR